MSIDRTIAARPAPGAFVAARAIALCACRLFLAGLARPIPRGARQ